MRGARQWGFCCLGWGRGLMFSDSRAVFMPCLRARHCPGLQEFIVCKGMWRRSF